MDSIKSKYSQVNSYYLFYLKNKYYIKGLEYSRTIYNHISICKLLNISIKEYMDMIYKFNGDLIDLPSSEYSTVFKKEQNVKMFNNYINSIIISNKLGGKHDKC